MRPRRRPTSSSEPRVQARLLRARGSAGRNARGGLRGRWRCDRRLRALLLVHRRHRHLLAREGADPAVGEVGEEEHVPEYRVELVVPADGVAAAIEALRASHPYEEVAFDLYALHTL